MPAHRTTVEEPLLYQATTATFEMAQRRSIGSGTLPLLQPEDRQLLLRSWTSVRRHDVGRYAFLKLFRRLPELQKQVFGFMSDRKPSTNPGDSTNTNSSLDQDERFQHHISIFTSVLDTVIVEVGCNVRFQEKVDPILLGLGSKHAKMFRSSKYLSKKPEYWDAFKEAVASSIVDVYRFSTNSTCSKMDHDSKVSCQHASTAADRVDLDELRHLHRAWTNFMAYVATTIRQGFDAEIAKTKQKTCSRLVKRSLRNAGVLIFGLVALAAMIVVMIYLSRAALPPAAEDPQRSSMGDRGSSLYLEQAVIGDKEEIQT